MKSLASFVGTAIQLTLILHKTYVPLCASASLISLSSCWPCANAFSLQPQDPDSSDRTAPRKQPRIGDTLNYQSSNGEDVGKPTDIDDELPVDDDVIDYVRSKQHRCINHVCAMVVSKYSSLMDMETCAIRFCSSGLLTVDQTPTISSPIKRWGNRLCMEIHCRSLQHDISSYVNCGVRHCTR